MTRRAIFTLLGLGSTYAGGLALLVSQTPARAEAPSPFPPGSSFRRSPDGSALASAYLRARGYRVLPLLTSSVSGVIPGSVVLVIDPPHLPPEFNRGRTLLTMEEERFVRSGGRVVLALGASVPSVELKNGTSLTWSRVHPDWPAAKDLDPGAAGKVLAGPWLRDAHTIFAAADEPVVARQNLGLGDVVAISSAQVFENANLDKAHNLEFLEALVSSRPAVYFDEGVHGLGANEGITDLLRQWNLGPFLLALTALALAILIRKGRSLGAPDRDEPPRHSDAVDLVEALGRLYSRSLGDDEALSLHRDHLRRVVSEKTGLRGQALRTRVDALLAKAGSKPKSPAHPFEKELVAVNQALRRAHEQPR